MYPRTPIPVLSPKHAKQAQAMTGKLCQSLGKWERFKVSGSNNKCGTKYLDLTKCSVRIFSFLQQMGVCSWRWYQESHFILFYFQQKYLLNNFKKSPNLRQVWKWLISLQSVHIMLSRGKSPDGLEILWYFPPSWISQWLPEEFCFKFDRLTSVRMNMVNNLKATESIQRTFQRILNYCILC